MIKKATLVVFLGILISRILGLLRETIIAYKYGVSSYTDAFLVAYVVPGILITLLANSMGMYLVPIFTEDRLKNKNSRKPMEETSVIISNFFLIFLITAVLVFIFSPHLIQLIGAGFSVEKRILATKLLRLMSPAVFLLGGAGILSGFCYSQKKFATNAIATIVFNIGVILPILLIVSNSPLHPLPLGIVLGSGLVFLPLAIKTLLLLKFQIKINFFLASFKNSLKQFFPYFLAVSVSQLNIVFGRLVASGLGEGAVSGLNFASRIIEALLGIFAMALGTALLPTLSEKFALGKEGEVKHFSLWGMRMLFFIIIPISLGLIFFKESVVALIYQRGAFGIEAVKITQSALLFYSFGLIFSGANIILVRSFLSIKDTVTPLKSSLLTVGLNIILNLILSRFLSYKGIALASSIAPSVGFVYLFLSFKKIGIKKNVRREIKNLWTSETKTLTVSFGKSFAATLLSLFVSYFVLRAYIKTTYYLPLLFLLAGTLYLFFATLLRMEEFEKLKRFALETVRFK